MAQYPSQRRDDSRLMTVNRSSGALGHFRVSDLPDLLRPDTLVVVNNSRVRRARVMAETEHGGEVEFLFLSPLEDRSLWKVITSKASRQKPGRLYRFPGGSQGSIEAVEGEFRLLRLDQPLQESWFEQHGAVPLPPYIKRDAEAEDIGRYQTAYARIAGSAAAPTAGLHFTPELLDRVREASAGIVEVTLHVGLGTFAPVRVEDIHAHEMHSEECEVSPETAARVREVKDSGGRILAIGTTSVRTLESAGRDGMPSDGRFATNLYITPGFEFRTVDMMFTNFHTPRSTLLMMVSAFAGYDLIMKAYREAVNREYRFFSYGDAMIMI